MNENGYFGIENASGNCLESPTRNRLQNLFVDIFHTGTTSQSDVRDHTILVDLELDGWRSFVGFTWKKLVGGYGDRLVHQRSIRALRRNLFRSCRLS